MVTAPSPAIAVTHDGGATWTRQGTATPGSLSSVVFLDGATGWAVGTDGLMLSTGDGGASWRVIESGLGGDINALSFAGTRKGWAAGESGAIISLVPADVAAGTGGTADGTAGTTAATP